jgi:hypothetical protein
VRLVRCDHGGIEANWSRILGLEKRELLTIVGQDDVLHPGFLEEIGRLVERHPEAALYRTHFRLVDESGRMLRPCRPLPEREDAATFLAARLRGERDSFATGWVMRSGDYDRIGGIPPFPRLLYADDALFLRLMAESWIATSHLDGFAYRVHAQSVSNSPALADLLSAWKSYAAFLETHEQSLGVRAALEQALPDHMARVFGTTYAFELERASRAGRRLDPALRADLMAILERHAPAVRREWESTTRVRFWETANRSPLRRAAAFMWAAGRDVRRGLRGGRDAV